MLLNILRGKTVTLSSLRMTFSEIPFSLHNHLLGAGGEGGCACIQATVRQTSLLLDQLCTLIWCPYSATGPSCPACSAVSQPWAFLGPAWRIWEERGVERWLSDHSEGTAGPSRRWLEKRRRGGPMFSKATLDHCPKAGGKPSQFPTQWKWTFLRWALLPV